jgi:transcriptional regulator with XRE-family HTH domain
MGITQNMYVGRTLRRWRLERGMTQAELSKLVGRSQSEISKIEHGERRLSYIETFVFCEALGKKYDTLAEEVRAEMLRDGLEPDLPDPDRIRRTPPDE